MGGFAFSRQATALKQTLRLTFCLGDSHLPNVRSKAIELWDVVAKSGDVDQICALGEVCGDFDHRRETSVNFDDVGQFRVSSGGPISAELGQFWGVFDLSVTCTANSVSTSTIFGELGSRLQETPTHPSDADRFRGDFDHFGANSVNSGEIVTSSGRLRPRRADQRLG